MNQIEPLRPIEPRSIRTIALIVDEHAPEPAMGREAFIRIAYRTRNPSLYKAVTSCDHWPAIQTSYRVSPTMYPDGIFGFAVKLGQDEVARGRTVIVQSDVEFTNPNPGLVFPLKVTVLTALIPSSDIDEPKIAFVIRGQLEPTS